MKVATNNPIANRLVNGVSESDLNEVIAKSGYPLQTLVANQLSSTFRLEEEWTYVDKDSKNQRTIDIHAQKSLYDFEKIKTKVRPTLDLLIECKRSDLPYVFFLTKNEYWLKDFPLYTGLREENIVVKTNDSKSTWLCRINEALGLENHAFRGKIPQCTTLTRCLRKPKLVVAGDESYHELVLPLIKAQQYFKMIEKPINSALYFDCHMIIALAVLDAPMVGVTVASESNEAILLPWVRLIRHEPITDSKLGTNDRVRYALEIIHKDFLRTYLDCYLLPFAAVFSSKVLRHSVELASGKGFAADLEKKGPSNMEPRLRAR